MHVGWHLELAGKCRSADDEQNTHVHRLFSHRKTAAWLLIGIVACQNNEVIPVDLDQVVEPDYRVELSVDTGIKSSPEQLAEQFACHECTDCQAKGSLSSRVCDAGVRMCYVSRLPDSFTDDRFLSA